MIVFDEAKRQTNLAKHGLDFYLLTDEFFQQATFYPAKLGRRLAVGVLNNQLIIAVVFQTPGSEGISIISMRPANRKERRKP